VVRGLYFTKLGEDIGLSSVRYKLVLALIYLAAFSHAGASELSDIENVAKFALLTPPCKNEGGVGKLL